MGEKDDNKKLREMVFDYCDSLGFWNVHPVTIAKKLGTAHQNVSRWKKQWIEKNGIPKIESFGKEMSANSTTLLKELMKLSKLGDNKLKLQAISTFFQSQEKFTQFLESFGYKEKIADKLDVKSENQTKIDLSEFENYMKEEKEDESDSSESDTKSD